jgi:hypothetical protein
LESSPREIAPLDERRMERHPGPMPTADDVRRLALALPEAYEDTHRGKPAFRVNKRIFAMLGVESAAAAPSFFAPLSGARPVASLTVDREDQLNFAAAYPQAFEAAGSYGFSYVWLDAVDPDLLAMLIGMSWAKAAPKRLARAMMRPPS